MSNSKNAIYNCQNRNNAEMTVSVKQDLMMSGVKFCAT